MTTESLLPRATETGASASRPVVLASAGSWRVPAAAGWEVVDVVGGASARVVDDLVAVHQTLFPGYRFVVGDIVADAAAPAERDGLVVHQWLVRYLGEPAGVMLFDTNVVRRVGVIHFLGLERSARRLRIGGTRLATWLCHRALDTLVTDLGAATAPPWGVFGESPDGLVRRWLGAGFRVVDLPYAEPAGGRHWRSGAEPVLRPMNLLWLPCRSGAAGQVAAGQVGAAAFLIDHYQLPLDHPAVIAATGGQGIGRGVRRWLS